MALKYPVPFTAKKKLIQENLIKNTRVRGQVLIRALIDSVLSIGFRILQWWCLVVVDYMFTYTHLLYIRVYI